MNQDEIKKALPELLECAGYEPRSYSGRGMYGDYCLSVNVERGKEISHVLKDIIDNNDLEGDEIEVSDLLDVLNRVSHDSMGLGQVLYWRGIPMKEDE